jgi:probable rRNA maturation factor
VCVRVVDREESRALNSRYRGMDKPTNVLSFPAQVDVPGEHILGDVVVCAAVVCAEAADQGKAVRDHYAHMIVHGVLHLTGYDHVKARDAQLMESLEKKILERVGVADPYIVS